MSFKPISGKTIFNALKDKPTIVHACNPRITIGVAEGVLRAAKKIDAPVLFELAKSECNQHIGYTGLTPDTFSKNVQKAADKVGHDIWALHADHIQIKKGDEADIEDTKELIDAQIKAGYTSFAIDASHLFDFKGKTVEDELAPNLKATIEIAKHIEKKMAGKEFGLEVEVGEIGRKDSKGMILTSPEEATTYIKKLNEAGIKPDVLAIANGSTHGNVYDEHGNPILQVSIDIERTKKIAKALRDMGSSVRIAQHGITGTPLHLIAEKFPHGDIIKGNVATHWQNLVWEVVKVFDPQLYKDAYGWTINNFKKEMPGKKEEEIFGKMGKKASKQFFDRIYALPQDAVDAIEAKVYADALMFFKAFNAGGTGKIVRKSL